MPNLEKPSGVDVDARELRELVVKEEGSTCPKPKEKRKAIKTILEMIIWGDVHEKLENEKITPISEVDEIILELIKIRRATMVKKALKSLKDHPILKDYVLR